MFQQHIRLSLLAVLAAGVLALSGCGSTKTKTVEVEVPGPTVEVPGPTVEVPGPTVEVPVGPPTFVDHSGLSDDVMHVENSAEIDAGESVTIGEVTYSCAAGSVDCTVKTDGDGTAVSTGGTVTAAVSSAYTTRIAEEARIAGLTKSAATKEKAISTEAAQMTDASLGGTARTDADNITDTATDDVYGLKISRDGDGTEIEITDPALAGDDDPKFEMAMDLGGGRTMHARTMEADDDGNVESEVVIVSTDIEAPEATAFAMVDDQALTVNSKTGVAAAGTGETDDALSIAQDATLTGTANSNLMFARTTTDGALNYSRDDPTETTADVDEGLHDGTYNGAEGTYRCTSDSNSCTVTFNAKGQVVGNSANWVFVPDKGATSNVQDSDFLAYGFWLKRTTDKDGAVTYDEVETFARNSLILPSGDVTRVLGSATYEGGAVGVYVHSVLKPDGMRGSATPGHFSADVELMATFGQVMEDGTNTIADNVVNTVTGTIDNFGLSGGEANSWSVALSADINGDTGTTTTATATAKGGMGDGSFNATFHGPVADVGGVVPKPSSVVGEFNAGFTNGSVAGAFGAREAKD